MGFSLKKFYRTAKRAKNAKKTFLNFAWLGGLRGSFL